MSTHGEGQVPGLATLDASTVERVLEVARVVHIPEGWSPIHQHEPADKAYLLLEGRMRVVSDDTAVAELGPGSFVGEMGLVDRRLRNARVTTVEPALALAWPRHVFQHLRRELWDFDDLVTRVSEARTRENQQR